MASERRTKNTPGISPIAVLAAPHLSPLQRKVVALTWFAEGTYIAAAVAPGRTILIWSVASSEIVDEIEFSDFGGISQLCADIDGLRLGIGTESGVVAIFDLSKRKTSILLQRDEREKQRSEIKGLAWSKDGKHLAASRLDGQIYLWAGKTLKPNPVIPVVSIPKSAEPIALSLQWATDSRCFAVASYFASVIDVLTGITSRTIRTPGLYDVAWSPDPSSKWMIGASADSTLRVWRSTKEKEYRVLEGHTSSPKRVRFSADGTVFASIDSKGHLIFGSLRFASDVPFEFNPSESLIAIGSAKTGDSNAVIEIWKIDLAEMQGAVKTKAVTYTSAKVVLVGDSGAGKTGLGWRLAHGDFKEHSSTHGQQFWLLEQLRITRPDGTECEAILWDLAGQPDYRLIHALFLDDVDLALILFDPTRSDDPLRGVEFWLKQLRIDQAIDNKDELRTAAVLVAARADRGTARLTTEEIETFCSDRKLAGFISTSALKGDGVQTLVDKMQAMIKWEDKTATVTTETFKSIKDHVLKLKESRRRTKVIYSPTDLLKRLQGSSKIRDDELLTAVGHLANHGYVTLLKTTSGEARILLSPELLNNLAASLVLEARRNPRGLGSIEESSLVSGEYDFPELHKVARAEQDTLLDSVVAMFLKHNVCFRETAPLNGKSYLVFPELINLRKPTTPNEEPIEDGTAYTVSGAVENAYSSLVVLLGYTNTFTRTNQWRDNARYEVGEGLICGFRLEADREGEQDFVLYFGVRVGDPVRKLFQSLFESFLARRKLKIRRYEPVRCPQLHQLNRAVVREQLARNSTSTFCSTCGSAITLTRSDGPIQLTNEQAENVEMEQRAAHQRSGFEQAIFRFKTYVEEKRIPAVECFISYAWGDVEQEKWVEKLATDLLNAGVLVVYDKWENTRIGASIPRFVEKVATAGKIIVVGTELYRQKYENESAVGGFVVAAEGDLIGKRMLGSEAKKETVLPILLQGTEEFSFPPFLNGRVYADYREESSYFPQTLQLLLTIYGLAGRRSLVDDLQKLLTQTSEKY
jgi:small GTP-binding protein